MFSGNLTSVPKAVGQITLRDIQAHFPLKGKYIFRYKFRHNKNSVWTDIIDFEDPIPQFDHKIFLKANRLAWTDEPSNKHSHSNVNANKGSYSNTNANKLTDGDKKEAKFGLGLGFEDFI